MNTPARSHWAWGYAERFPSDARRAELAQTLGFALAIDPPALRPLPSIDDARAPEPRVEVPEALRGFCTADRDARVRHTYGRGYLDVLRGFQGDFATAPDLVARPTSEDHIAEAFEYCARSHVALVPFGGGTSVVGGVECTERARFAGVMCLDMSAFDKLLEVDAVSRAARIQAGALGPHIETLLRPYDLSLRHYPQSFEFSTLGGWIATRAGGHFATLYTHIDDLVESVRMLTPAGVFETPRLAASGAGPSPDRLVLGSEGTLGVITEAWVRVHPRPKFRLSASVRFDEFAHAVDAARAVSQSGLYPSNCRVLDPTEALISAVSLDGSSVLLLGFESADHRPDAAMARALQIAGAHRGTPSAVRVREGDTPAQDTRDGRSQQWRDVFLEAPYLQSAMVTLGVMADTFETSCTWDKFADLHAEIASVVHDALAREGTPGRVGCRFTHVYPDGPAPYYTFIAPQRADDPEGQWLRVKRAASETLRRHGATITHHHAVGRTHRPWYDRERPELFARVLRAARRELDPAGILNPEVLVSEP